MIRKLLAVAVALLLVGCATSGTSGGGAAGDATPGTQLFPGRADAQKKDQERAMGAAAQIGGLQAAVNTAVHKTKLSDFEDKGYIVVSVSYLNTADKAQPYNTFEWKLQAPGGTVNDPTVTTGQDLGSGDLVKGGQKAGEIVFEVGQPKGDYYIIWKPSAFDAGRGIWKVSF